MTEEDNTTHMQTGNEQTYHGTLRNLSQALVRISELDEVVTTEGELAVAYQTSVWLPRLKLMMFLGAVGGLVLGGVIGGGAGATWGCVIGLFVLPLPQWITFSIMNSGNSEKLEHRHHVALVRAQRETYYLIGQVWKPNLAFLKKYTRKNRGNLGEYAQLGASLIDADAWVKTLTLKAQTAKLMKAQAADSLKTALIFAGAAVAITGVAMDVVGTASQGIGETRYRVTNSDGMSWEETR
jgi:hypothetical protein